MVSGDKNGCVVIWDTENGKKVNEFIGIPKIPRRDWQPGIVGIKLGRNEDHVITVCTDDCVRIFDIYRGIEIGTYKGLFDSVYDACCFSFDGRRIITNGVDPGIFYWDLDKGEDDCCQRIGNFMVDHAIGMSNDGYSVFCREYPENDKLLKEYHENIPLVHILVSLDEYKIVNIIDIFQLDNKPQQNENQISEIELLAQNYFRDKEYIDWDENEFETIVDLSDADTIPDIPIIEYFYDVYELTAITLSRDGKTCVVGDTAGVIKIIDLSLGKVILWEAVHKNTVTHVGISPNGKYIASCDETNEIILWAM